MSKTEVFTSRRFQREFSAARAVADAGTVVEITVGGRRYSFRRENPTAPPARRPPPGLSERGLRAWAISERARQNGLEQWDTERIRQEVRERRGGIDSRGEGQPDA